MQPTKQNPRRDVRLIARSLAAALAATVLCGTIALAAQGEAPAPPAFQAPPYLRTLMEGRDLLLNRQYEEARRYFRDYGASHPDDPAGPIGEALVAVIERAETRDFTSSNELDRVFEKAREAARRWSKRQGGHNQGEFFVGAAEAMQALWWLKTDHAFRGISRALSAAGHIQDAARGEGSLSDARGALGMYLYLKGRYGHRYTFLVPDTRKEGKRAADRCTQDAPVLGPLCELFLLYVAKWEDRWGDLDLRAEAFRERYPRSMFAAIIQAEGLLSDAHAGEALSVLHEAGQYDPEYGLLHYWRGVAYWDGLREALPAQEAWEYAIQRGLGQPARGADAQAGLGEIALSQGLLAEARIRFEWALKLDGANPRARLGWKTLAEREKELLRKQDKP